MGDFEFSVNAEGSRRILNRNTERNGNRRRRLRVCECLRGVSVGLIETRVSNERRALQLGIHLERSSGEEAPLFVQRDISRSCSASAPVQKAGENDSNAMYEIARGLDI